LGISYKERMNRKKLTGDERTAYLQSVYFITSIIGIGILFIGSVSTALALYYLHAQSMLVWSLVLMFVGLLVILAARALKVPDKTEKIPA
jgi:hypothetical protein